MKKCFLFFFIILLFNNSVKSVDAELILPDSAYIFGYSTIKNNSRNGLHFAWSNDRKNWNPIGSEMRFLFCDYGNWGNQKRLVTPFLFRGNDGFWHCVWSLNESEGVFAHSYTSDFIYWYPQTYPTVSKDRNLLQPEVKYDASNKRYSISWLSTKDRGFDIYGTSTEDFKIFSPTLQLSEKERFNLRDTVFVNGNNETGTILKVAKADIERLLNKKKTEDYRKAQNEETTKDDAVKYAGLNILQTTVTVFGNERKAISDKLIGVFFEDINYAADGGLYAELVQNRGFEYQLSDRNDRDKNWDSYKSWSLVGDAAAFVIDTVNPIHFNNPHYAILHTTKVGASLQNEGFNGIPLQAGEQFNISLFARNPGKNSQSLQIKLIDQSGEILGTTFIKIKGKGWKKYESVITSSKTEAKARLEITPLKTGNIHLDMISLFPQKTFNGRKNGLRTDLAQLIADLHPRFIRFPGGCVAHGDGLANMYRWKNTIGPLESRKPQRNIWNYHQTAGLGYFEYFLFCEDIGAEPLPVVAAGVPCQNSSHGGAGQQGGVPMCEMHDYVQEVLDLIEWANGDAKKTFWGRKRAEAGHSEPFNLKYVGVGNEDLINEIFEERFTMIFKAVKEKYPEITVIGTVGPFNEGTDYVEGWKIADKLQIPMVDEHYYQTPGWFINNHDFYDKYDRSKSKVYLGEYAAHLPGRPNNLETALTEAHYLTTLERNGDIVSMTSYAPLLAKEGFTQWNPDLIYFNNTEVKPTVGYFVQKLYGQNSGNQYLSNKVEISVENPDVRKRIASSVVYDSITGDYIIKLVNILPVSMETKIILKDIPNLQTEAIKTVLTGYPADKNTQPVSENIQLKSEFICQQPAYSFTLIRIKTKKP